ncbi:ribosome biogenesis GTPase YlqF [Thermoleptolyngbya sichuanensis XZ-Cy5]|uniref:ribosome biogenesis GTPase YlqF n=1 Tax=Thermoleptolyngbya sichuanensis TaxID=2885951 RepID=UPI00240D2175|nr:ribosome biogenesis GTPase YlqF [Thermoleptolyngbya sichuanensis]MDG2616688.1 ribosome biogenesis GTPase YlqF [Thermoleptolyngbya sichuanensis XZ-Cy5]
MSTPPIQWYPGHIAKAERSLLEQLKKVDVVLEVRDARIPIATRHPQMGQWLGNKERVLVLNRMDMIPAGVQQDWRTWFQQQDDTAYFTDANHGKGVEAVSRAAQALGAKMNQRRRDRGMLPRPVRAVVIGFPNVGKSALINRLLKRRVVESARRPGVTRQLRWIRISDELELLDAPGILPSKLTNQQSALKLAICDDIGEAAYDNQRVAAAFVDLWKELSEAAPTLIGSGLETRYGLSPSGVTGETYLAQLAEHRYQNDVERAARQLLNDFRKGLLGAVPLELPPAAIAAEGQGNPDERAEERAEEKSGEHSGAQ